MRIISSALALALAVARAAAPAEACEGHSYVRAEIDPLPPPLAGMRVEVHKTMGAQLVLENRTERTVEVLDADGVPFLRIGPHGVDGNVSAASWYRSYSPAAVVPANATAGAPRWVRAASEPAYGWFDGRVDAAHVPLPLAVIEAGRAADLGGWSVPLRVGGQSTVLTGRFRYEPPPDGVYVARLTSSPAPAAGVRVTLLPGRRPGLMVQNASDRPLLVFGVTGEPFLRIGPAGVEANVHSATWRRSARATASASAAGEHAPPHWQRVASTPRYSWIEPRAAVSDAAVGAAQWSVPMQLGAEALEITGEATWRRAGGA